MTEHQRSALAELAIAAIKVADTGNWYKTSDNRLGKLKAAIRIAETAFPALKENK